MEIYEKYIRKNREFELTTAEKNDVTESLKSVFLEIESDGYIISAPKKKNNIYHLEKGKYINIYIYAEDGIYRLKCKVNQASSEFYKISKAISVEHSQRREYLRVGIKVNVKMAVEDNGRTRNYEFKSNNLCGKGMNFGLEEKIYNYDKIHVEFTLNDRVIRTYAAIAYCRKQDSLSGVKYNTAINFTSISQQDIDYIAKECLLRQLEDRQKSARNLG